MEREETRSGVSWPVAVLWAVAAVAAAAVALAVFPHLMVSRLTALPREGRVALATAYEVAAFALVAWRAVALQRRGGR